MMMGNPNRLYISKTQVAEIEEARRKNKYKNIDKRLRAILLHAQGKSHEEISELTEYAASYIGDIVAKYVDNGITSITGNNYHGNRRNLSLDEEKALLDKFKEQAQQGQTIDVSDIKKAYEEAIGRTLDSSRGQIYRVLKRHGWRKVMPRSKHPNKASDEEIAASKKTLLK